jgi:hypothetical protein
VLFAKIVAVGAEARGAPFGHPSDSTRYPWPGVVDDVTSVANRPSELTEK